MRYRMRDKIGYRMEWDILVYDGMYIYIRIYNGIHDPLSIRTWWYVSKSIGPRWMAYMSNAMHPVASKSYVPQLLSDSLWGFQWVP